ncbi:hypothetical protein N431DRAFT_465944 [Stipitochalara longipes BDJ]|nr:hypothetical protein N431DRAFT_465944 [Stipitochalara longipes BDJ]
MLSNTKTFQGKLRSEKKRGSSPKLSASLTDPDVPPNEPPATDHQHYLHRVASGGPPASFAQHPSQSCGYCADFSMDVQPSHDHTPILSQQGPSTNELLSFKFGSAHGANCPPNSTGQPEDELHLPTNMNLYSPIERWEAQTPMEDTWSTFVAFENRARESICVEGQLGDSITLGVHACERTFPEQR